MLLLYLTFRNDNTNTAIKQMNTRWRHKLGYTPEMLATLYVGLFNK